MNSFGKRIGFISFGESHGEAIGGVMEGCPAGCVLDFEAIQHELDRRRPGQSAITTARKEPDRVEFLSGIFEGKTTGTPIGFIIRNTNQNSGDYEALRHTFRPSHADYTYQVKYGIRDHRGGGRSSARETAARVVAGAIAKQILASYGISITAYTSQVGNIALEKTYQELNLSQVDNNPVRCPDNETACRMEELIRQVQVEGDTIGGIISCVCQGVPAGLGEPVFGKLHAVLGSAMLSINAAKGFEYGMGFAGAARRGSEMNDAFYESEDGKLRTLTNHSGGIQGGISNGEDIYFRVAFKPIATLLKDTQGRHDPCVLPRAVPIVEAMAAITLLDFLV